MPQYGDQLIRLVVVLDWLSNLLQEKSIQIQLRLLVRQTILRMRAEKAGLPMADVASSDQSGYGAHAVLMQIHVHIAFRIRRRQVHAPVFLAENDLTARYVVGKIIFSSSPSDRFAREMRLSNDELTPGAITQRFATILALV